VKNPPMRTITQRKIQAVFDPAPNYAFAERGVQCDTQNLNLIAVKGHHRNNLASRTSNLPYRETIAVRTGGDQELGSKQFPRERAR
jgi:hypothetical protein